MRNVNSCSALMACCCLCSLPPPSLPACCQAAPSGDRKNLGIHARILPFSYCAPIDTHTHIYIYMYIRLYIVYILYKFMSYCLQSKLFHLFVFITSKSRSMPRVASVGHVPVSSSGSSSGSGRLPFSTAFAFNGRRLFGDFPHLNSGRDLQIFDAHIFRCCFVLLIGAVPAL